MKKIILSRDEPVSEIYFARGSDYNPVVYPVFSRGEAPIPEGEQHKNAFQ